MPCLKNENVLIIYTMQMNRVQHRHKILYIFYLCRQNHTEFQYQPVIGHKIKMIVVIMLVFLI